MEGFSWAFLPLQIDKQLNVGFYFFLFGSLHSAY